MKSFSNQNSRSQLRKQLRHKRRNLSIAQQKTASLKLAGRLFASQSIQRAKHIAVYLAGDGEIDPAVFVEQAKRRGKHIFLPSLHPIRKGHLWFGHVNQKRKQNRFGIWEPSPRYRSMYQARHMDIVLMPLVGFDLTGARLGMGGGFYDRTFAFKLKNPATKPKLIGLAHHFQKVDKLPNEPWDVPLNAVVTDQQYYEV